MAQTANRSNTVTSVEDAIGGPKPMQDRGNRNSPTVDDTKVAKYDYQALAPKYDSKAALIRYLSSEGLTRAEIVKVFINGGSPIRYQQVRQVLTTPVSTAKEDNTSTTE